MIAMIDYDAGNIKSVEKALLYLGEEAILTRDPQILEQADGVILPGVGSFGDAMEKLHFYGLVPVIRRLAASATPFLGICLGLQLLFERSDESPGVDGLGILKGEIVRFPSQTGLKIPQIGWNELHYPNERVRGRLFADLPPNPYVYFVHSYYLRAADPAIVTATADYGISFHASVERNNLFACQFHPEKSSDLGLAMLRNFIRLAQKPTSKFQPDT
jgi:glutamine amidotransferase